MLLATGGETLCLRFIEGTCMLVRTDEDGKPGYPTAVPPGMRLVICGDLSKSFRKANGLTGTHHDAYYDGEGNVFFMQSEKSAALEDLPIDAVILVVGMFSGQEIARIFEKHLAVAA